MSFRFPESSLPDRCLATLNFPIDGTTVRCRGLGNSTNNGEKEHERAAGKMANNHDGLGRARSQLMFADSMIQVPRVGLGQVGLTAMLVSNGEKLMSYLESNMEVEQLSRLR